MIIVGVDTGGTFTDFIFKDGDTWSVYKRLSTPANPAEAVVNGLMRIAADRPKQVVHGSTVATNAILERKGVRTALITNERFEDIIEIGRQNRTRLYDLAYRKEPHIVPRELRYGVSGRVLCTGEIHEELDVEEAKKVVKAIQSSEAESVAVCLLFSYLNPSHELKIEEMLSELDIPVSLSHRILSEFREFERTSTTVINAYVSPKMGKYISFLLDHFGPEDGLRVMQSNGGSISAQTAMSESVRTILSGPAGGAVGAFEISKMAGHNRIITFDMGGTSTDVALIDGALPLTLESSISNYPVKAPMIDIHTVGAGGGSLAYKDVGGSLKVGPESAGADPGPICYGRGDQITVTDANLYLGRLAPEHFLGGAMKLETEKLESHFREMARDLGLSIVELAEGILRVANTNMEKAIRVISVERGFDPREFVLFSFGGAGSMHAAFLAKLLNIPKVMIPKNPGILSAIGMLMADIIKDYSQTVMLNQHTTDQAQLSGLFGSLEERGKADLLIEGVESGDIVLERYLDMRYEGQSYEMIVPFTAGYIEDFHRLHEKTYGYRNQDKTVEIVNLRLRSRGAPVKPTYKKEEFVSAEPSPEALLGEREVIFDSTPVPAKLYSRDELACGNRIEGPAIIIEYSSTIVVPPFARGSVDEYGNILLEIC